MLSDRELSIVFDYLTLHHQVKIETIFAETYTEKKEEPKAAPAPAAASPRPRPLGGERTAGRREMAAPQAAARLSGSRRGRQAASPPQRRGGHDPRAGKEDRGYPQVNVNLDKYDEKLQDMAERSERRRRDAATI